MADEREDALVVADLIEACRLVVRFAGGLDERDFRNNPLVWSAVSFQIIVLGEAVKSRLSEDVCDRYPQISWKDIKGMRDKLSHRHVSLDLGEVWRAARGNIPELLDELLTIERDLIGS